MLLVLLLAALDYFVAFVYIYTLYSNIGQSPPTLVLPGVSTHTSIKVVKYYQ